MVDIKKRKFGIYKKVGEAKTVKEAKYMVSNTDMFGKGNYKIGKGCFS